MSILSGKEFKATYGTTFYKVINPYTTRFKYQEGLNVDNNDLVSPIGGMCFTTMKDIVNYISRSEDEISIVTIPDDARVHVEGYHFKADKIILGSKIYKLDFESNLEAVKQTGMSLQFIENPTPEFQLAAVEQDSYAIQFIPNPTPEMCLTAVRQDGFSIQCIKNPSIEVQLEAVKQNPEAIQFITDPSPELQLIAVKRDGMSIAYIKNPTGEVQHEAVKQNSKALKYINSKLYMH